MYYYYFYYGQSHIWRFILYLALTLPQSNWWLRQIVIMEYKNHSDWLRIQPMRYSEPWVRLHIYKCNNTLHHVTLILPLRSLKQGKFGRVVHHSELVEQGLNDLPCAGLGADVQVLGTISREVKRGPPRGGHLGLAILWQFAWRRQRNGTSQLKLHPDEPCVWAVLILQRSQGTVNRTSRLHGNLAAIYMSVQTECYNGFTYVHHEVVIVDLGIVFLYLLLDFTNSQFLLSPFNLFILT